MHWQSKLRRPFLRSLLTVGVGGLLLVLGLLAGYAPLHHFLHHDEEGAHHCAVCTFAKGQVLAPESALIGALIPLLSFVLPVLFPVVAPARRACLLPPGRAPPALLAVS